MKIFTLNCMIIVYFLASLFGALSFHYENNKMGIMGPDCHKTNCINILDDISIWHNLLSSFLPILKIILITFSLFYLYFFSQIIKNLKYLFKIKLNKYIENYYQELFSKGILNPKSP